MKFLIISILFLNLFKIVVGLRAKPLNIVINEIRVKPNPLNSTIEAKLREVDGEKLLDANFTVKIRLKRPVLRITFQVKLSDGSYSKAIYNRTKDLCDIFSHPEENPMFLNVYESVRDYGNLPEKCPITQQNFCFKNFKLNSGTFPSWYPKAKFLLTVVGWDAADKKKQLFGHVLIFGEIKRKS